MHGKRVLVTGGAGFIGSNLANALASDNDVTVVDDCSLGTPTYLPDSVTFQQRSVLDDELPTDVDIVFHFASRSSYAMHEGALCRGVRVDVEGFVNVLEQARADGCETVVYASTSSVYGDQTDPVSEDQPVVANTGYEAASLARERYAEYFSTHHGLSVAGVRLFSVYQGYGGAERHKDEFANVIAQFAGDIAAGRSPTLYGDGTQTRDFTHVSDVVRGVICAAETRLDGIYNLGTGTRHSFNQVVESINDELGTAVEPTYITNPIPADIYVHDTCADSTKLSAATDWQPAVAFETGISRVCAPYR